MRPEKSAVVCTLPRSGSYLLCDGMGQTGVLGHPAEYYNVNNEGYYRELIGDSRAENYDIVFDYAMRIGTGANGVFGTKILYHQLAQMKAGFDRCGSYAGLSPLAIIDRLLPDPHYIHLIRADKLLQAISYYRAVSSGVWWRFDERQTVAEASLPQYDFAAIRHWLRAMQEWESGWATLLAALDRPVLTLQYDEVVGDFEGTIERVCDFLAVGRAHATGRVRSELKKQSDATTAEWAERFEADSVFEPASVRTVAHCG